MPKTKIITEGENLQKAFIIKEGECVLFSDRNPILPKSTNRGNNIVCQYKRRHQRKGKAPTCIEERLHLRHNEHILDRYED